MRSIRVLTVAALALPLALSAQQPAAPPPANPITGAFKGSGSQYARWLAMAFDSIPGDKYNYKPTPIQLSIGNVAQHLESANYQLCTAFGGISHATTAKDSLAD
jgi:hypothetical protein